MNCRPALLAYIKKLEKDYVPWYLRASRCHYVMWNILSLLPLVAGVGSAVIAALVKENQFQEQGRIWLITLPLIGGFSSTLLAKFRCDLMEDLRERAYIKISKLVEQAKADEAAADDPTCKVIHDRLVDSIHDLEQQQHEGAWAILKPPIK